MDQSNKVSANDEISIKDVIVKSKNVFKYLKRKWLIIGAISLLCALIGLWYSLSQKPIYSALSTFVLEDGGSKSGGLGQYAGLAAFTGLDVGSGGGIFQGDNIIALYKSRTMLEKTFLSEVSIYGKKQRLLDRYIDFNHLRAVWQLNPQTKNLSFNGDPDNFSRVQDSVMTNIIEPFNGKSLMVTKPDKKLSIIYVEVTSNDEIFAKEFANKLVENVNNFYVTTKTKKVLQSVVTLQHQNDSIRSVLNASLNGVATAVDATPNPNPSLVSLRVPSQKKQIDVQVNTAMYTEIVKNLQTSKISLRQETPLIQVIDKPVLPLPVKRVSKSKSMVIGFIVGFIITCIVLISRKAYINLLA